ncbi:hypothetical protein QNK09_12060 [Brevibacillus agri]|uniref:hypothetical protein n=1 Tax=Brevibacillus agri TaxID=51101 RepID=UPI000472097C|nr:hypothetical protein [Brevibacillus agri]WHX32889.1 hypothetical protein QNK09_12060 [Brevibacillus agri]
MDDTRVTEQQEEQKSLEVEGDIVDTAPDEQKQPKKPPKKNVDMITLSEHQAVVEGLQTEIEALKVQMAELEQFKPKVKTEHEIEIEQKQKALFEKEIELELKAANLHEFKDFFKPDNVEQLTEMIKTFQELLNKRRVPTGFIPTDHKQQDKYTQAKSQGNVKDMIKAKLFG